MKFTILVLFAMVLAANAKLKYVTLNDILGVQSFEETNEIEDGEPVANQIYTPRNLKTCNSVMCEQSCWRNGWQHGMCISSTRCHCYNDYIVSFV